MIYKKYLPATVLMVATAILAWVLSDIGQRFIPALSSSSDSQPVQVKSSAKPSPGDYRTNQIIAAHLFGETAKSKPVVRQAPETRLGLTLLGVLASNKDRNARAVIALDSARDRALDAARDRESRRQRRIKDTRRQRRIKDKSGRAVTVSDSTRDRGSRRQRSYSIGDRIKGTDAKLYAVEKDWVIIERGKRLEKLSLDRPDFDDEYQEQAPIIVSNRRQIEALRRPQLADAGQAGSDKPSPGISDFVAQRRDDKPEPLTPVDKHDKPEPLTPVVEHDKPEPLTPVVEHDKPEPLTPVDKHDKQAPELSVTQLTAQRSARAVAPARVPSKEAASGSVSEPEIDMFVRAWADAWSRQDITDYLAFYADNFRPADGSSHEAWRKTRHRRVTRPKFIELKISDITIEDLGAFRARVTFRQAYRADRYQDKVDKTLELAHARGQWRIVSEIAR